MKPVSVYILFILTSFCVPVKPYAQSGGITKGEPFSFEASYLGEMVNNFSGGIKKGSCYLGMGSFNVSFDTNKAGLWKGGRIFIHAANTHGASPSSELLGDIQVASNIDAGNHSYLQELWVSQVLGNLEITAGLQDLNVEFASSEYGELFLNSSFGVLPVISGNMAAPIFPLTSLGFTLKWTISERAVWINALYDGNPTDFDYNPYNVKWQFISGDGLLAISEYHHLTKINSLPGFYKLGIYSHSHIVENSLGRNIPDSLNNSLFGIYSYADQKIWQNENKSLGIFTQVGFSPSGNCENSFYLGMGMNYTGLISADGKDRFGIAIAHACYKSTVYNETAIELTYQYGFTKNIFVQPDVQYIINPSGTGMPLDNCLTGNIRFGISF